MAGTFNATVDASSLAPPPPPGMLRAIGLALLAHALLIAALTWGVHWKQQDSPAIEAEIWSSVTQQAAPRAVEPPAVQPDPTPPPTPVKPEPPARVEPPPAPDPAIREAQIALEREKKRRELAQQREQEQAEREQQQRKAAAEKKRQDQLQKDREAQARKEADAQALAKRKAAEQADAKRKAERDKEQAQKAQQQEQRDAEARRQDNIRRAQGLAGASGGPAATGTAMQSTGPSASYGARVSARVRPNIVFPDDLAGNPSADVEVRCAPDGTIVSRRLVKSSGVKSWDEAVLRAIDKTETLPRDVDGRVPALLTIGFRPKDG